MELLILSTLLLFLFAKTLKTRVRQLEHLLRLKDQRVAELETRFSRLEAKMSAVKTLVAQDVDKDRRT